MSSKSGLFHLKSFVFNTQTLKIIYKQSGTKPWLNNINKIQSFDERIYELSSIDLKRQIIQKNKFTN